RRRPALPRRARPGAPAGPGLSPALPGHRRLYLRFWNGWESRAVVTSIRARHSAGRSSRTSLRSVSTEVLRPDSTCMHDHLLCAHFPEEHPMTIARTLRTFGASAALAVTATLFAGPAQAADLPYGQDVSNYQPTHDWAASGADFGIVKATEGVDFKDKTFARHWKELAKHDVVRGAYHFGHPKN